MSLNLTTSLIKSPVNEKNFICTQYKAEFDDASKMVVELVSEEYDEKPVIYGQDCDENTLHGEWVASFYPLGEDTPFLSIGIGSSVLGAAFGTAERPRLGINILGMEGNTEANAEHAVVQQVFRQLLTPPGAPNLAHIVTDDRVKMAEWMLSKGLYRANGEVKTHCRAHCCDYNRIWKVLDNTITVKQTLMNMELGASLRQSRLFKADEHLVRTFEQVRTGQYAYMTTQFQAQETEYHYGDKVITNQHLVQHVLAFDRAGFSPAFINLFIEESEAMAAKQPQQPMMGGMNFPMFGAGSSPLSPMQFGNPGIPTGHPATDAANGMPHMDPASTTQQMHFQPQLNQGYPIGGHHYDPCTGKQF